MKLAWGRREDPSYPFEAELDGDKLVIRLNDFPDETLYTLMVNDEEFLSFDDWPASWPRP